MTTDEVLAELAARGLKVVLTPDGSPALLGKREEVTPALMGALRWHRDEIVRRLKPADAPRPREWLWRFGHRYTEGPRDSRFGDPEWHPIGAFWWRFVGEKEWELVPGRPGENYEIPEVP